MRRLYAVLSLTLGLAGCHLPGRTAGYPALLVDNRPFNSAIVNFSPPQLRQR